MEGVPQGIVQAACMVMKTYLQSSGYKRARQTRTKTWKGRGIAMAAGRAYNLINAYVTLHMLRNVHKSTLPVEFFFNGEQEFDLASQQFFQNDFSGLTYIDVSQHRLPLHMSWIQKTKNMSEMQDGWVVKAQMLYHTSFEEVLVLDSDNVPLRDPAFLFDSMEYRAHGNLFWPDFWTHNFMSPGQAYTFLKLKDPWEKEPNTVTTESGQFLIDRRRHDDVLEWVVMLNLHAETMYELIYGDKDTYRLGFHLAGKASAFSQIKHKPSNALHKPDYALEHTKLASDSSEIEQEDKGDFPWWYTHAGMIQMGPEGNMLFLHRTSDAKLDPFLVYPPGYEAIQHITVPLSPRQAEVVHLSGGMDTNKFETDKARKCAKVKGLGLTMMAVSCGIMDQGKPQSGDQPDLVPLFSIDQFPGLRLQLNQTMRAFRHLQQLFLTEKIRLGHPAPIPSS